MAIVKLKINNQDTEVDTTRFPELVNAVLTDNEAALQGRITAAVKVEKDKLYGTIDQLKSKNKELLGDYASLENEFNTLSQAPPAAPAAPQAPTTQAAAATPVAAPITASTTTEAPTSANTGMMEAITKLIDNKLAPVASFIEKQNAESITAYKDRRIAELGDSVIPEIVSGNTVAEIEESIVSSIALAQKYSPTTPQTPQNTVAPTTSSSVDANGNPIAAAPQTPPATQGVAPQTAAPVAVPAPPPAQAVENQVQNNNSQSIYSVPNTQGTFVPQEGAQSMGESYQGQPARTTIQHPPVDGRTTIAPVDVKNMTHEQFAEHRRSLRMT